MKKIIPFALFLIGSVACYAKDNAKYYPANTISEKLKTNAHAVIRYDKTDIKVVDFDKVIYKRKCAITILDEKGKRYAPFVESYNLLRMINNIEGHLFDSTGTEIRTLKEKEVSDYSTYGSSYAYHSDVRIKSYDFGYSKYPYTVEYEIDQVIKTTFFIPEWETQTDHDCSVEQIEFTLSYPASIPVRFKEYLMPASVEKSLSKDEDGDDLLSWKLKDIYAYKEEPYAKTGNHTSPTVILAPGKFELLKYKGDMESWKNIGLFIYKLNEGRDVLPEDKKALVKSITAGEKDVYNKVQKLYAYMQQNTRYVANEYGIAQKIYDRIE